MKTYLTALLSCLVLSCFGATITVQTGSPGTPVPRTLHGIFFEDINYAGDGGLYAELVQNRSFEDHDPLFAWKPWPDGTLEAATDSPLNASNPTYLRLAAGAGAVNDGFDGIALRQGDGYLFSVYARRHSGESGELKVNLLDAFDHVLASAAFSDISDAWRKLEAPLDATVSITNARLAIVAGKSAAMDVDMVSLFPEKTFKGRRNGLRADLAQALADMKPGFVRFPGGCIVEGQSFSNMYRWKDTVGDVAERKANWDLWRNDRSPHYDQSYGLGFFEFFQFAEDIGAEPLPVLNCGLCCQARRGPPVPLDKLQPYIQDALDLVEFANGPADSPWGSRRAAMGHPEPFHLKYLAVGNEQWQQSYFDRYPLFYSALKVKYPDLNIISSSGPFVGDRNWTFAWEKFRSGVPADMVDEHYYVPPQWLLGHVDRYESYDPHGPKIFVGEFAARSGARRNSLRGALAEAAYMTGLERHADVVSMASYAPLLSKFGHSQWQPDLVWFDNTRVLLTPNYHAQALFAQTLPDAALPTSVDSPIAGPVARGSVGVGAWRTKAEFKDIRVESADGRTLYHSDFSKGLADWRTAGGDWQAVDGVLRQSALEENARAITGDPAWSDYNLTLKARKLAGSEGFLVLFETLNIDAPVWWNLGGWDNSQHGLQGEGLAEARTPGQIETGRWYDVRIESRAGGVKAYLDGKLVQEGQRHPTATLFASCGRDNRSGDLVLKVVNYSEQPQSAQIDLAGMHGVEGPVRALTLASDNPDDENSLSDPDRVKPLASEFAVQSPQFQHEFPKWSLTILRVNAN